ncbi:Os04g0450850 [Oryza sativa Japonica Group]|uniref:Os04g0450850 protein n=1 Tax=Oryza sativa subsp. japonica TaxID=39947 RepID=A0A0P0WB71_ORYSJ|nr:Os04g0450850 [Oryza sativa Japonica Group]
MVHNTRPSVNSAKIKSENHEVESNNVGHFIMSQRKKKKTRRQIISEAGRRIMKTYQLRLWYVSFSSYCISSKIK